MPLVNSDADQDHRHHVSTIQADLANNLNDLCRGVGTLHHISATRPRPSAPALRFQWRNGACYAIRERASFGLGHRRAGGWQHHLGHGNDLSAATVDVVSDNNNSITGIAEPRLV